ncbi:hypothetical protein CAP35_00895 [Chitinophagaceae bacterium IBVUCB1]|nr:hypothetical protein CAP35_00895 [Chitinophagaceae bacterium IBVUCB1]
MKRVLPLRKLESAQAGWHLIKNRKTMWCMLKAVWRRQYSISGLSKWLLLAGTLYILLPFDFDWIPILGWLDDAAILLLMIKRLQKETQRFVRAKVMERRADC